MKRLLILIPLLFVPSVVFAQNAVEKPTCVIVKHAGGFSAFANNANWEYVAGDFPKGVKWTPHLTDRALRKIREKGGRVVVLEPKAEDLAQAQKRCD